MWRHRHRRSSVSKEQIVEAISSPNFVGGHPMAGSEKSGLDGVDEELFNGATWVLTPTEQTSPDAYVAVRNVVTTFGASSSDGRPGRTRLRRRHHKPRAPSLPPAP